MKTIARPGKGSIKTRSSLFYIFQYSRHVLPVLHLNRRKKDAWEFCVRLQLIIEDPTKNNALKEKEKLQPEQHKMSAREQRIFMSNYYGGKPNARKYFRSGSC